ncbi:MAG: hypothetical protein D6706_01230 [Chloroflexi bacterium]|nr:MAG: hypothetical protein D6706_01230 [Chloroflexota bacterium]
MRHDFSDQIQVRYVHPNGENFDTWVSGEEVLGRLKTMSREQLIRSFSRMRWHEARKRLEEEIEQGKRSLHQKLKSRLADIVSENLGENIFADTLADNIRGVDDTEASHIREKRLWQTRLQNEAFRAVVLELAWAQIGDVLPPEADEQSEPNDWV